MKTQSFKKQNCHYIFEVFEICNTPESDAEVVQPLRAGDQIMVQQYRRILSSPGITSLPFPENAAEAFAGVRLNTGIRPPDAIQLAIASVAGCDLFLTSDERLVKAIVPGIHFITSFEKAPF
jgi:predicted nucleic acid-binding protein